MQQLSDLLTSIDSAIGGSQWFVFLLLGTGNIAGVAFALHLGGGPAALFWVLVTAVIGTTTKFVEVTLSHKK